MKRWRILLLALCIVLACSLPASAEKTDWEDKAYDFAAAQRVLVYDIHLTDTAEFENDLLGPVLQDEYMKNAMRPKYVLVRPGQGETPAPGSPREGADLYVTAELLKWHDDFYIRPEYTTWERQEYTRTKRHSDGTKSRETYYVSVPVVHPPRRIDTSTVRIRFEVYDAKTGKRVLARDEIRVRDDSTRGEKGIFGRITKSFFDDFAKKLKRK